jgi:hypothetical protein
MPPLLAYRGWHARERVGNRYERFEVVGASRKHTSTPPPVIAGRDSNPIPAWAISLPVPPISFPNIPVVPDRSGATGGVRDLPIESVGSWLRAPERVPCVLCIGSRDMLTN